MSEYHEFAARGKLAERYVLGELGEAEAEAFEEHFFDCGECAAEVRESQRMVANLKATAREGDLGPRKAKRSHKQ